MNCINFTVTMNPCPCGNYPDFSKCSCTPWQIRQYLSHISQPLLDRIDICAEAPRVQYADIRDRKTIENSADIRERIARVRSIQQRRYDRERKGQLPGKVNAALNVREIEEYCQLGKEEELLMKRAFTSMGLTARTYHKILKVARTIADLDESEQILIHHLKEAIGYRTVDKKYWGR